MKLLFIGLLLGTSFTVISQEDDLKKREAEANAYYNRALFEQALHLYEVLVANSPRNEEYYTRYQYCLEQTKNPSVNRLDFMLTKIKEGEGEAQLYLDVARLYKEKKDCEKAIVYYEMYANNSSKSDVKKQQIKKKIKVCKKALK